MHSEVTEQTAIGFRSQFILAADTLAVVAVELLAAVPARLPYHDPEAMLEHDLAMIDNARRIHGGRSSMRVHVNVEPPSLMLGLEALLPVCDGIVIEIVERHQDSQTSSYLHNLVAAVKALRRAGALIAFDDITPTSFEMAMIEEVGPDIIKVNNPRSGKQAAACGYGKNCILVGERVETKAQADSARLMGFHELQGRYCDGHLRAQSSARLQTA